MHSIAGKDKNPLRLERTFKRRGGGAPIKFSIAENRNKHAINEHEARLRVSQGRSVSS